MVTNSRELFNLKVNTAISKKNLYDLIQYSKQKGSKYWCGEDYVVGNTPQQGINWIGLLPNRNWLAHVKTLNGVIIKVERGSYKDDGWLNNKTGYKYSFKAQKSQINYNEKANKVLIDQPKYGYPILLFIRHEKRRDVWLFQGVFHVEKIKMTHVILNKGNIDNELNLQEESTFIEGSRKYVTHLIRERSREVVAHKKKMKPWLCDICNFDFNSCYGYEYIEAHHKKPISDAEEEYVVKQNDLSLLCPNCHRAVHIYMKKTQLDYEGIKKSIQSVFLR